MLNIANEVFNAPRRFLSAAVVVFFGSLLILLGDKGEDDNV